MKILVIAPHPDDEVLGVGGTIARHTRAGDRVDVVIVTRGDKSYDQLWIDRSRDEAKRAHALLGVSATTFCDFPSPTLDTVPTAVVVDALRRLVDHDVVYIPDRNDLHQEHRLVHEAARVACRAPGPDVYAYETVSETECGYGFVPNHFVDITDSLAAKVAAFEEFTTQVLPVPSPRSAVGICALAHTRGYAVGCYAAEAFRTIRTVKR